MNRSFVAVIPARGGSKRVPRKNVRPFLGVPLIQRTIRTVLEAGVFDRLVVSTDDDEIARLAEDAGAEVPFMRPAELADDHTATASVIRHAIERLEVEGSAHIDTVCGIYATAALLTREDISDAADRFAVERPDLMFAAAAHPAPVERSWVVSEEGLASLRWPEYRLTRTQDLPVSYFDVGWFYFGNRQYWMTDGMSRGTSRVYLIDRRRAIDIDTEEDWRLAEELARGWH